MFVRNEHKLVMLTWSFGMLKVEYVRYVKLSQIMSAK